VVLLTDPERISPFVTELATDEDLEGLVVTVGLKEAMRRCPECHVGHLQVRQGKHGTFHGCSEWPVCSHTEKITTKGRAGASGPEAAAPAVPQRQRKAQATAAVCRGCGKGRMQRREGKYGPFMGCSRWPRCDHTYSI
jgi:DNA helicase IV